MRKITKVTALVIALALVLTLSVLPMQAFAAEATSEEAPTNTVKIYFQNTLGWDKVYFYCWNMAVGTVGENWPGSEMTLVKGTKDWYTCDYNSDLTMNIIFNNSNGLQTSNSNPADLPVDGIDTYWFVASENTEETAGGRATGYIVEIYSEAQSGFPGYVNVLAIVLIVVGVVVVAAVIVIVVLNKKKQGK